MVWWSSISTWTLEAVDVGQLMWMQGACRITIWKVCITVHAEKRSPSQWKKDTCSAWGEHGGARAPLAFSHLFLNSLHHFNQECFNKMVLLVNMPFESELPPLPYIIKVVSVSVLLLSWFLHLFSCNFYLINFGRLTWWLTLWKRTMWYGLL